MFNASRIWRSALLLVLLLPLAACGQDDSTAASDKPAVRGLKTFQVKDQEQNTTRKYPGILQPSSISTLSFEVGGKLETVALDVGQAVKKGQVLASLDPKTLALQVDSAKAALQQAESAAKTARDDYDRKLVLLKKGVIAQAAADKSRNETQSADAQLVQAKKQLETARENLGKAELKAPFDGIINTVEAKSFTNVTPGAAIVTLYSTEAFEASFSVNYEVANLIVVGKKAVVRLADNPSIEIDAHISELGAKADTVSSFPVVVRLNNATPNLKAGMAIEIALEFVVDRGKGFLLPLTILSLEGNEQLAKSRIKNDIAFVYVFDNDTSTVKRREIKIGGIRENSLIVVDGLKAGEHVASAGVSFLRDGQAVKLLSRPGRE